MNVLSVCDGMSCGQIALQKEHIDVDNYFASEIDPYAMKVTMANFPNTKQIGDISKVNVFDLPKIDLLIGGTPCLDFSFAGKQQGMVTKDKVEILTLEHYLSLKNQGYEFEGESYLFWEYVRILQDIRKSNPEVKFLLENVRMHKKWKDLITNILGVEPLDINSSLVSAQNRKRLYWTNISGATVPIDRNITLSSILEELPDCPIGVKVREKSLCVRVGGKNSPFGSKQIWDSPFQRVSKKGKVKPSVEKSACLTGGAHSGGNHSDMDIIHTPFATRRYSTIECERLQTVPDNYTNHVSNSQRYKMLGNGWTVAVIAYILKELKHVS